MGKPSRFQESRLRQQMEESSLDGLIVTSPVNVQYLTGTYLLTSEFVPERLSFAIYPLDGEPTFVVNQLEYTLAKDTSWIKNILMYQGAEWGFPVRPIDFLCAAIRETGMSKSRIGLEMNRLGSSDFHYLESQLSEAEFVDDSLVLARTRMIKTNEEIDILTKAAEITIRAAKEAFESSKPGDSERKVAREILMNMLRFGMKRVDFMALGSGRRSHIVHCDPTDKKLSVGDVVRTDFGGRLDGYFADTARSVVVGRDSSKSHPILDKVSRIHQSVVRTIRPGVKCSEIFNHCKELFKSEGVEFSMPHIGHSIGLELHEYPMINPTLDVPLEANMVINVEPGFFRAGVGGYHVEDTLLLTNNGTELLTKEMPVGRAFEIT